MGNREKWRRLRGREGGSKKGRRMRGTNLVHDLEGTLEARSGVPSLSELAVLPSVCHERVTQGAGIHPLDKERATACCQEQGGGQGEKG